MSVNLECNCPKPKCNPQFGMALKINPSARNLIKFNNSSKGQAKLLRSLYKNAPEHFDVTVSEDQFLKNHLWVQIYDGKYAYKQFTQGTLSAMFQSPIKWIEKQLKFAQKLEDKYYNAK